MCYIYVYITFNIRNHITMVSVCNKGHNDHLKCFTLEYIIPQIRDISAELLYHVIITLSRSDIVSIMLNVITTHFEVSSLTQLSDESKSTTQRVNILIKLLWRSGDTISKNMAYCKLGEIIS